MDYAALKSEILSDPLSRGYAGMSDEQIAADLNTAYRSRMVPLPSNTVLKWMAGSGRYQKIQDAADDSITKNAETRSVCKGALAMINHPGAVFDFNDSETVGLFDALIAAGVLTPTDKTNAQALATESITRGAEQGFGRVRPGDVSFARTV